jgi:hypothetical protein
MSPIKRFNYFPTPTAWQQSIAWRRRRLEAEERIERNITPIVNGLANAQYNQITGMAEIALKMANARIAEEMAAKLGKLNKLKANRTA